jgi:hypothetical protein
MLTRWTALFCAVTFCCAFADGRIARSNEVKHLMLSEMAPGSQFEITTNDRIYRGEMVDAATGEVRLAASLDGVRFTEPRTVFLLGATQGRAPETGGLMLVKMNTLQTGLCVELGLGSLSERDRQLTQPVRSIRVR